MKKSIVVAVVLVLAVMPIDAVAKDHGWKTLKDDKQLREYLYKDFARRYYPVDVKCRAKNGKFQLRIKSAKAGPDKPYHKWSATFLRPGETHEQAAARLPIKGHTEVKYRAKYLCTAAGKTIAVAFRGTRALD
ncbi:hypothetical protein [Marimonas arenosa]|uniref:Uncharacterized protein n=1 Tax=Marimonas arenosa TaxID=1795305 RepID=A0AAE3WE54_9RHOB|nr:hypothetical protein [Marimonas arenosa]MDQ2091346.1 hypothetical protein [Marimonas arenosa]